MLAVNLLPQEEKVIIRMTEACRAVTLFTLCFLLIAITGVALLLPSYFYSHFFRLELERTLAVAEQDASGRGTAHEILIEAKRIRNNIMEVRTSLTISAAGADIMEKFSAPGEGIAVTSLFIRSTGDVAIDGRAGTRDQLLAFEQRLRASGLFLEVSFPLADIVRERDIRFSAKAKLKLPSGL
ncbi:MAG: hypothetical protein WAP52_02065 [Candidatus Sungiibacteriota bacterium]